jgi:hypothetical protein
MRTVAQLARDGLDLLDLYGCPVGAGGAQVVATLPEGPHVLDLGCCGIRDEGVKALTEWPGLSRCRMLSLRGNGITAVGIAALARSPYTGGLMGLRLAGNPIGDRGFPQLLDAPFAARLELLDVAGCDLTAHAIEALPGPFASLKDLRHGLTLPPSAQARLSSIECRG